MQKEAFSDELCWVYVPLPSQSKFLALRSRLKGFSGPVGSGKSAALSFEALRQSFMNAGRQGMLAAPTLAMLRDATLTTMFHAMEEQDIDFELRKVGWRADDYIAGQHDSAALARRAGTPCAGQTWRGSESTSYRTRARKAG